MNTSAILIIFEIHWKFAKLAAILFDAGGAQRSDLRNHNPPFQSNVIAGRWIPKELTRRHRNILHLGLPRFLATVKR